MTELRLVSDRAEEGPFSSDAPLPRRLPPGRHGIPTNLVVEHQRRRLILAIAEAVADRGYANVTTTDVSELANVSTSTFYKHFGNLWDCALAAYVSAADHLCAEIEGACTAADEQTPRLAVGVDAALAFCATEPAQARLLSAAAPLETTAIAAARRLLVSRLATMLRRGGAPDAGGPRPPGLDERMIDATLTFIGARITSGQTDDLIDLGPELVAILDRQRQAA